MSGTIAYPWPEPPQIGQALEVAEGVLWMRLPLPMALDHVNVYALADTDGWTLIDTGMNSGKTRAIWQGLLDGPLAGKPVVRVVLTHHHPDHCGLVGWFQSRGAELITTRTAWLYARMLTLDVQDRAAPESMLFYARAGTPPARLEMRAQERPFNFSDVVAPMPLGFTRISEGDVLTLGQRRWRVRIGQGHAPDHATLWSEDDNLILGGDQLLPSISANIGVYPTEPEADPLSEWMAAVEGYVPHARADHLVLPGHKLPYTGLPTRLRQMADNHHGALARLLADLAQPRRATECFSALFKREIGDGEYGLALVEAIAHLNYLLRRGQVSRSLGDDGAWIWRAV